MPTSHPSTDELIAFAQGSLDEPQAIAIEVHVAMCEDCAAAVSAAPNDGFIEQLLVAERSGVTEHFMVRDRIESDKRAPVADSKATAKPLDARRLKETDGWRSGAGLGDLPSDLGAHPRLEFKGRIATGAMGTVYVALDRQLAQFVAVKVLNREWAANDKRKRRFLEEARIAARLRHPHIAAVLEHEPYGETAYFTMEFVDGETLADLVARQGPLSVVAASDYVRQAAMALEHAHQRGVIHRDIKPHNLMLETTTGRLKVLDFGLGRMVDEQRSGTRLTREGEVLGTLGFLSPEQALDARQADARSDLYSLGCTFFFVLTGRAPFRGRNAVEMLNQHASAKPPAIGSVRPDIPGSVASLIDRMLAKAPHDRPQSANELAAELAPVSSLGKADAPRVNVRGAFHAWNLLRAACSPAVVLPLITLLLLLCWLLMR